MTTPPNSQPGNPADSLPAEPADIRALGRPDLPQLAALLLQIPASEHQFVKYDISRPELVRAWIDATSAHWDGAFDAERLIGAVAVVKGEGWSSHVGELRMVVHPRHRHAGIGTALARTALINAIEAGYHVVTVQALAEQTRVLNLFRGLGFVPEAMLTDHVRDPDGTLHDLVVLTHSVQAAAQRLHAFGDAS